MTQNQKWVYEELCVKGDSIFYSLGKIEGLATSAPKEKEIRAIAQDIVKKLNKLMGLTNDN